MTTPTILISEPKMTLTIDVRRTDGNDLDELTARYVAKQRLLARRHLGTCAGNWRYSDAERTNYDAVRVRFTQ
jgi:hypothetical protein